MKFDPKSAISKGKIAQPLRILCYGCEGIGKTTLASKSPRPLFIGTEDGSAHLDVPRVTPDSWMGGEKSLLEIVSWFGTPDAAEYQTLVIDTADMAERLCIEYVCKRDNNTPEPTKKYNRETYIDGKPYLDGYGYGGGAKIVETEFLALLAAMDRARRQRNVHFVWTAHSDIAREKNASGDDFGVIVPRLLKQVRDQICSWCDAVLYAEFSRIELNPAAKDKNKVAIGKAKVVTDGTRIMHTTRADGAYFAKNRLGLPPVIDMEWSTITEYAQEAYGDATTQIAQLLESIAALSSSLPEERRAKLAMLVEKNKASVLALVEIKGKVMAAVAAEPVNYVLPLMRRDETSKEGQS